MARTRPIEDVLRELAAEVPAEEWEAFKTQNEKVAALIAVAKEIANDPKCDLVTSERRMRLYGALHALGELED